MLECPWSKWFELNTTNWKDWTGSKKGVYRIDTGSPNSITVYVGEGDIGERLNDHLDDVRIQAYKEHNLYAKYAFISNNFNRKGAEAYLQRTLQPVVGNRSDHEEVEILS